MVLLFRTFASKEAEAEMIPLEVADEEVPDVPEMREGSPQVQDGKNEAQTLGTSGADFRLKLFVSDFVKGRNTEVSPKYLMRAPEDQNRFVNQGFFGGTRHL